MSDSAPGGLSWESFQSASLDVGDWIWGTAQGAFNEKASLSQIVVDAVIGMIPLVGDVTAARDLIAVVIGLSNDPRKREDKFQWVMLVVLIFALIPVIGGVIKGVGRLLLRALGEVAHLAAGAERAAHMARAAQDIVAFLNRIGVGNAERFLTRLRFAEHQQAVLSKLDELVATLTRVLQSANSRIGAWVPALSSGTERMLTGLRFVKQAAPRYIPDALKQLDEYLREVQNYIRSGGETTSQALAHTTEAGAANVHRADEALMLREGRSAARSARGGWAANSPRQADVAARYRAEPGFPDLLAWRQTAADGSATFPNIATYSGEIVNRELRSGEQVFRVFGPAGSTHGTAIGASNAAGGRLGSPSFWGLNDVPSSAEAWRQGSAVLDEWNRNGFLVIGTILDGHTMPACTGVIAEQAGTKIGSQYLAGGSKQAMLQVDQAVGQQLNTLGQRVVASGTPTTVDLGGVRWEIHATGWPDVNGIYGYLNMPGPAAVQTVRLGARTIASKQEDE